MYFGEIPKNLQTLPWGVDTNRKDFNVYFIFDPQRIEVQVFEGEDHLVVREKRRLESKGWKVRMKFSEGPSKLLATRSKNLSPPKST